MPYFLSNIERRKTEGKARRIKKNWKIVGFPLYRILTPCDMENSIYDKRKKNDADSRCFIY